MKMHSGFAFSCPEFEEILVNDSYNPYKYVPYPKLDVLAMFSSAVYTDYAVNEDHEKYEKKLNLPDGWKLLTTAFKGKINYKYFGIALWNSQLQEVVLVHRGTKIRIDWLTNFTGVFLNIYTSHMECAMSFAERIKFAIQRANKSDKCFRLSITGHSLGGWLAQITGFSVKYLRAEGSKFTEISDLNDGLHAHVVVFDSPGCRDMLEKIQSKYMPRYNKTMYIRNIDITIYFCVPNLVNAIGLHVGSLYQITSKLPNLELSYINITEITHAIKYFIDALKECPGSQEIRDWPIFNVMTTELKNAYKMLSLGYIKEPRPEQWKKCRCKLVEFDGTASASLSTFSENEFRILDCWNTLKKEAPNKRFIFITDILGNVFYKDFLIDRYDKYKITCQSKESLETVIHYTQLLARRHYPRFTEIMGKFFVANNNYVANLPYCCVEFDTIAIQEFLESPKHILHIKIDSSKKCRKLEMTRLYSILCQLRKEKYLSNLDKYLDYGKQTFIDLELLETIQNPDGDGTDFTQDNLLVVDCVKNLDQDSNCCELKRILKKLKIFNKMKKNCDKKIILVTSHDLTTFFKTLKISFCETNENVGLTHFAESSQEGVVKNKILVGGESLAAYAGTGTTEIINHIDSSVHKREVKGLMTDTKFILEIDNPAPECAEPYVASTHNTEMTLQEVERVLNHSPGALLLISAHSHSEDSTPIRLNELNQIAKRFKITLKTVKSEKEELLEKILQENTHEMVYLFQVSDDKIVFKKMFKHCYIDRNFHHQMVFDFKKTENCTDDIFEVQGAQDEELSFFSKNIPTAASDEHVQNVNIDAGKHIVKFEGTIRRCVLQRSEGSLKGIRPYISNYTDKPIEEKTFWENLQKTVIIADEHDTGKSTSLRRAPRFLHSSWVIYANVKEFRTFTDLSSITEFLLPDNGSTDKLRRKVFEFCLDNNNKSSRRVYLLFDDVNEEDNILTLLKFLKYESAAHVCVTTQIYQKKILEDELSVFATSFERSTKSQQKDYLTNCLCWGVFLIPESVKRKLDECVMIFHSEAENMLGSNIHTFLGNPRRIQHLGSILMERISYFDWSKQLGNFSETNVVFEFYQKLTSLNKYFVQANLRENAKMIFMENLSETFRKLAITQLFSGKGILKTDIDKKWNLEAVRTGQVQSGGDKFIHPTLAVYHLAGLIGPFFNGNIAYLHPKPLVQLILFEILPSDSWKLARLFINHFLITDPPRFEALQHISDEIDLWDEENCKKAFAKAINESNKHILECLKMLCQIKLATKARDINDSQELREF